MANKIETVDRYPYSLGAFGTGLKYVILEDDYYLYFGKRRKEDGSYELYAKVTSRYYPHDIIPNGEKIGIKIYKVGELPSASWTLDSKNKNIHLFLSNTTSYLNDSPTLPEDIQNDFDSSEPDLSTGLIQNKDNIYDIISETGAFFDPQRSYRQYALVRSGYTGMLYQKKTAEVSEPSDEQKDPYQDQVNWNIINLGGGSGGGSGTTTSYVDLQTNQSINGQKTFLNSLYKGEITANPTALEVLCYKEAENNFLKINDTAANAKKLMNYNPSEVGGAQAGKQVVVVTNNEGKIDDTFLNASIVSNERNLIVDPSKSDGITTFDTIQEAWDVASKMIILGNITIQVADGTYTKTNGYPVMNFTNIYDAGKISIIGNINNPENCIIRFSNTQQGLHFTGKGLYINGFTFQQQETEKGTSIGINIDAGASIVFGKSVILENCNTGLNVSELSFVDADYLQANNCNIGFKIDSSTANLNYSKTQSCYTSCIADNNSVVYARGSIYNKGSIQTTNTVGFQVSYGSIVRAPETLGSSDLDKPYNDAQTNRPNETLGIIEFS